MNRRKFLLTASGLSLTGLLIGKNLLSGNDFQSDVQFNENVEPQTYFFKDDGRIPNSKYPLLVYTYVFSLTGTKGAEWLEKTFKANNWYNSWRWGVYSFHHYHSNAHEVLGIFQGSAQLQMGGEKGKILSVKAGDILVIPAGVGHKNVKSSSDFTAVGAYPDGMDWDLNKGEKGERPRADENIAKVPLPSTDPLLGKKGGVVKYWK